MPSRAPAAGISPGSNSTSAAVADERRQHPDDRVGRQRVQARGETDAQHDDADAQPRRRARQRDGAVLVQRRAPRRPAPARRIPTARCHRISAATSGSATTAEIRRCARLGSATGRRASAGAANLLARAAEAALAAPVRLQRLVELGLAERRPERLGEVQLGVGRLPEQEVRQPLLARRADQQVQLGQPAGLQRRREPLLGDLVEAERRRSRPPRTARAPPRRSTRGRRRTAPGTASSPRLLGRIAHQRVQRLLRRTRAAGPPRRWRSGGCRCP